MSVYKVENYVDDFNRNVSVRTSIDEGEQKTIYIGSVLITTSKGNFPIEFKFPDVEGASLASCFETFDDTLKVFVEEKQKEARSKIVTPQDMGNDQIIQ